jgi:hypothetical protein
MAFDFPDDLIDLQRAFLAAERHWSQAARGDGDDMAVNEAYQETQRLTMELRRHPWWATLPNGRFEARAALCETAGASGSEKPPASSGAGA